MILPWVQKCGRDFAAGALAMGTHLGWPPDYAPWSLSCIAFESDETFSPSVKNKAGSGATGEIQFMPKIAINLGTTVEALAAMTALEQLEYVRKYFLWCAPRIRSLADMYMAILMPKYIGAPGDTPIFIKASGYDYYRQNSGLDANTDGKVTVDEAVDRVREKLARGYLPQFVGHV